MNAIKYIFEVFYWNAHEYTAYCFEKPLNTRSLGTKIGVQNKVI